MPRRDDLHRILIIGSGPIIIGQACEFDYSGTQAAKALGADGYEVIAVQYSLESFDEDVAMVKRTLNRVGSPVLLVGHSYGGATITASGVDGRVAGLVYIGAVAPDVGETVQDQLNKYPSDIFSRVEVADGYA